MPRWRAAVGIACVVIVAGCGSSSVATTPASATPTPAPPRPIVVAGERSQLGDAGLYIVNADGSGLRHVANTASTAIARRRSRLMASA